MAEPNRWDSDVLSVRGLCGPWLCHRPRKRDLQTFREFGSILIFAIIRFRSASMMSRPPLRPAQNRPTATGGERSACHILESGTPRVALTERP